MAKGSSDYETLFYGVKQRYKECRAELIETEGACSELMDINDSLNKKIAELEKRLSVYEGPQTYKTECSECGQSWVTSLGTEFTCQCCGAFIHAKPELKIASPKND